MTIVWCEKRIRMWFQRCVKHHLVFTIRTPYRRDRCLSLPSIILIFKTPQLVGGKTVEYLNPYKKYVKKDWNGV